MDCANHNLFCAKSTKPSKFKKHVQNKMINFPWICMINVFGIYHLKSSVKSGC